MLKQKFGTIKNKEEKKMSEIRKYHNEELMKANLKKQILIAGTEALILENVDPGKHIVFLKLSNILKAYQDAYDRIKSEIEYHQNAISLDNEIEKSIIENGGEKNDSESL